MRAVLSAEGNPEAREIIARTFDPISAAFIDAVLDCVPGAAREDVVWRSQFLLGALYYTLINPERISRLSNGAADGADQARAVEEIVRAGCAAFSALEQASGAADGPGPDAAEDRPGPGRAGA
jgi:hypothetical protein